MKITYPERNFVASFLGPKNATRPSAMNIILKELNCIIVYGITIKQYICLTVQYALSYWSNMAKRSEDG